MPWLRDQLWTQGYIWGFKAFRNLVLYLGRFQFAPETMPADFLSLPQRVVDEIVEIGSKLIPEVPEENICGLYPIDANLLTLPWNSEESSEDEAEAFWGHCPLVDSKWNIYIYIYIYIYISF